MDITIRRYSPVDWAALQVIHDSARVDELTGSVGVEAFLDLAATFENEGLFDGLVWVAEVDARVEGFLAIDGDEITWMYVNPSLYRHGIGRALLRKVMLDATGPIHLEVLEGNERAFAFYRDHGFRVTRTTSGQLTGNEAFTATGHTMTWTPVDHR